MLAAFAAVTVVTIMVALYAGVLLIVADDDNTFPLAEPQPRPQHLKLHAGARVVFCDGDHASLTVDCALIELDPPDASLPAGVPFAIRLRTPQTAWFEEVTMALLSDWATDERIIVVEVSRDGRRAALDDGATRFCLELEALSGLDQVA